MKFYIPHASSDEQAATVYQAIKSFAKDMTGWDASDRHIRRIEYVHEGKRYTAEVGELEPRTHEEVIAILETAPKKGLPYLVCTPNRGVVRGEPMLVGDNEIRDIEDFEP